MCKRGILHIMLNKIYINGYKSIKQLELELKPINILIGANGSGKSNFLSFFEFLESVYNNNIKYYVEQRGHSYKFLHKGNKHTQQISSTLYFANKNISYQFTLEENDNNSFIVKNSEIIENNLKKDLLHNTKNMDELLNIINELVKKNNNHNISKTFDEKVTQTLYLLNEYKKDIHLIDLIKKYHFHDTGRNSPFNQFSNIEQDIFFLETTGRNLAAFLYNIRENNLETYNFILSTIQSIAPYFLDFFLQPHPNKNSDIRLLWKHKEFEQIMSATDLSDGTIRFIAIATLFLQPNLPQTIIIDEPELGLHPFAIAKLAGMIKSASQQNCQVIVATQSVELLNHFEPNDVITVDQIDGESKFKRLDNSELEHWLEDYTLGDLWQRNIINNGQVNY